MKDNYTVALEVLADYYGTGQARRETLSSLGYNYEDVQTIVNSLVRDGMTADRAKAKLKGIEENEAKKPLEIDYDMSKNNGIIINIIM